MTSLPVLLLGPVVRRAEKQQIRIQLATSQALEPVFKLHQHPSEQHTETLRLGEHLYLHNCTLTPVNGAFSTDIHLAYSLYFGSEAHDLGDYCYADTRAPSVLIPEQLRSVLHGSCRNPHHYSEDALVQGDKLMQQSHSNAEKRPQLLLLSGDQIYADDVAGPMLLAIHQLIERLGIYREGEQLIALSQQVQDDLYNRACKLPHTPWQKRSKWQLGYWLRRDEPHFSSVKSANHLVHFEEFIALYLLSLGAPCWQLIDTEQLQLSDSHPHYQTFQQERTHVLDFAASQPYAARLFAHVSSLMIFDDHDVTDDWNLTANWEQAVYTHPASRAIIGNAMLSYALFQGWGNCANDTPWPFFEALKKARGDGFWHLAPLYKPLLNYDYWHYELPTSPKVVVLDTRTHRWRNEQDFNEPSGLLDWQRLLELENSLQGSEQVLLVSPAPVFGVKSIEAIQAVFTLCNQPLMVDCENWMAHEGSAKKLLNIFRRLDTPQETIILSGDVHYSFCFSVRARFSERENRIWQLTASGIKNEFPRKLINVLDKLDSILYSPRSPLNLFTKRWQMKVDKHDTTSGPQKHLVSHAAISLVELEHGKLCRYRLLHSDNSVTEYELD
ncbi:metallophosphatase [Pseudoalteromonas sp. Cnat2-41]|uniref:metallophosphatase n=1 Tax=unclassified Pseudoalteromonas TaxID=194690 RepID=UPI001EF871A6|nr:MULTISPECIES: metallophosphatase [unclassified Pseudoalteromonas]MCF2861375.1 metallophosphatase [Pseudoalteromonas sp. CNAT2-18]MCG7557586.1 metallophosphatase [Pseudoalteromonas sp. CNAT2-18.1]